MAIEVGKRYYFIVHAYYHFVAEVVSILGVKRLWVKDVRFVYNCARDWTAFFREGFKKDTTYKVFPDGEIDGWIAAFEWKNPIPEA